MDQLAVAVGVEFCGRDADQAPDFYRGEAPGVNLAAHGARGDGQGGGCLGDGEVWHQRSLVNSITHTHGFDDHVARLALRESHR